MNYTHLTIEEHSCIRKYYVDGLSYRKIAELIEHSPSTGSREIRRNCTHMYDIPTYYPHTAQKKYLLRRPYCHRGMFQSEDVIRYINEKLLATWSPEQIANTPCELNLPSQRTIYRWIYEKYLVNSNLKVLRRKGKNHGSKETRLYLFYLSFRLSLLKPLPVTAERSLQTGPILKPDCIVMFTLPIFIVHGRRVLTKTQMGCSGSFVRKEEISQESAQRL